MGRDSSVGIATHYGLDGLEIDSRWERDIPYTFRLSLWPTQAPVILVPSLFPGGKAAGAWHSSPTPSSLEVKERVELYLYSLSGPTWPVLEYKFIFYLL